MHLSWSLRVKIYGIYHQRTAYYCSGDYKYIDVGSPDIHTIIYWYQDGMGSIHNYSHGLTESFVEYLARGHNIEYNNIVFLCLIFIEITSVHKNLP